MPDVLVHHPSRRGHAAKDACLGFPVGDGEIEAFPPCPANFLEPCTAKVINISHIKETNIAGKEVVSVFHPDPAGLT